jgi:hypothetical protein
LGSLLVHNHRSTGMNPPVAINLITPIQRPVDNRAATVRAHFLAQFLYLSDGSPTRGAGNKARPRLDLQCKSAR